MLTVEELLRTVDARLYRANANGRIASRREVGLGRKRRDFARRGMIQP